MAKSPSALPLGAPEAAASPPRGPSGQRRASLGALTCEHLVGPSRMAREMSWLHASPRWPYSVSRCLLCWRRPWQERTFLLFPRAEPQEAASAPRQNSLGSSPKNALSSTRLLSNTRLPPVRFKLATSVPSALSTHARNGAESFKISRQVGRRGFA